MKKRICLLLVLALFALAVSPAFAEENEGTVPPFSDVLSRYEQIISGTWKIVWRHIPTTASQLYKLSDPIKPVNVFRYPGDFTKGGMTVTSYLLGNDTGEVYLMLVTAGSSHGIVSFDGGWTGKVSLTSDGSMLLLSGVDGSSMLYRRADGETSE